MSYIVFNSIIIHLFNYKYYLIQLLFIFLIIYYYLIQLLLISLITLLHKLNNFPWRLIYKILYFNFKEFSKSQAIQLIIPPSPWEDVKYYFPKFI